MKFMHDDSLMHMNDALYDAWVEQQLEFRISKPTVQQLAREFKYWRDSLRADAWDDGARNGCMCSPPEVKNPWRNNLEIYDEEWVNETAD